MNLTWLEFVVAGMAVYRVTLMVVREKGPGHIFKKVREAPSKASKVYDWLTCQFCFSMTVSGLACLGMWLSGHREHYAWWFMIWCGLSGGSIAVHMHFNREEP